MDNFRCASFRRAYAFPRRDAPELRLSFPPKRTRAWGMPGARCARSRAWWVVNTRVSHRTPPGSPGIPARNGFNGFLRALPGDRLFDSHILKAQSGAVFDASVGFEA